MNRFMIIAVALVALPFVVTTGALAQSGPDEPTTAAVDVTVWRSVSDPSLLYVSTRPEGGRWRTLNTALDMSALSSSGNFHQSNAVRVAVPLTGGGTANVDVTVWRSVSDPSLLYVSTRPEGGRWRTLNTALDMSALSSSGNFHQSNAVRVEVPLGASGSDRAALVALYHSTGGPGWITRTNWLSGRPLDAWHGVTTGSDGRVTGLDLSENQLTGPIPAELGRLSNLEWLTLSDNQLTGPIPAWLGDLTNLEGLNLQYNQLTGPIPAELGDLTNLESLWLNTNELTGPIPAELGDLTNLEALVLNTNELTGPIPAWLGNLTNLKSLSLSGNELTGPIPAGLGNLTNLSWLGLWENGLTGPIPAELGDLTNLGTLILSVNELTGPIPAELGGLTNLQALSLRSNELTGPIPAWLGNLTNLKSLSLRSNELTGPIPAELGDLANLERLNLAGNQLTGPIPAWLGDLTNLRELGLLDNELTGPIPAELGGLSNLKWLSLWGNELTGPIPAELGDLTNLEQLWLGGNELTGPIPAALGDLTNLSVLELGGNELTGPIPAELGDLTNLRELYLSDNELKGCVPVGLRDVAENDLGELNLPDCGAATPRATVTPTPTHTLVFSDLNWTSVQVQNRIAQYLVEMGYAYPTDVVLGATFPLFQGLRRGDTHVTMEIWLPNQDEAWAEALAAGEVVSLGPSLGKDWQSAFVIPAYLQEEYPDLDSVEDLKDEKFKELFASAETGGKARLVSCVIGWACEEVNAAQIAGYGLSDHVEIINPGDGAAANADLFGAYQKGEPWLGYTWGTAAPALILDLVRLDEPAYSDECWFTTKACAYKDATVLIAVHPDVVTDAPDVVAMLREWTFDVVRYGQVAAWLGDNPDADANDGALWWLIGNEDVWSSWVTEDAASAIRDALDDGELPDGWPDAS